MLKVTNVTQTYKSGNKSLTVLDSINFSIEKGSISDENGAYKILVNANRFQKILYTSIFYNDLKSNKGLGKAISDPTTGSYSIVLPFGQRYSFMAEKEGYYAVTENVDLSNLNEYKEIRRCGGESN